MFWFLTLQNMNFYNTWRCGSSATKLCSDFLFQIQGKFYIRIDPLGEGAKWRRTTGQEIYSPLLLAFTEQVKHRNWVDWLSLTKVLTQSFFFWQDGSDWMNSHVSKFSGIDPSYALPNNIAVITLQVCMLNVNLNIDSQWNIIGFEDATSHFFIYTHISFPLLSYLF